MDISFAPKWPFVQPEKIPKLYISGLTFWTSFFEDKRRTAFPVQCCRKEIYSVWNDFLATRLFHLRSWSADIYCLCRTLHSDFRPCFLRLGLPSDNFYGNAFQADRILDHW